MANGDVFVIHVGGDTDFADCGTLHNTVTIGADNEPAGADGNNTAEADIVVNCPVLGIAKTADHEAPVLIGSQIGFTITVHNGGQGTAFGVSVSDTLDSRFTWSIESQTGDLTWQLAGNVLTASGDLAPGDAVVHVVANDRASQIAHPVRPRPEHGDADPGRDRVPAGLGRRGGPMPGDRRHQDLE